ncbi:hypothetical protein [Thaumasiovibrio sp. DFM-14]|uniref:hypothetical protein n=1 Tax=Thaumasiovibrio sp. DFM-14 TaxID=3384792 RepID=UPI0039A39791
MNRLVFIRNHIAANLSSQGLPPHCANFYAHRGVVYYQNVVSNSKDPFKDACDYAGKLAASRIASFNYQPVKQPPSRRSIKARPQSLFDFDSQERKS